MLTPFRFTVLLASSLVLGSLFCHAADPIEEASKTKWLLPPGFTAVKDAGYAALEGLAPGSKEAQEAQKRAVESLKLPLEVKSNRLEITFRLIPPGTFLMGTAGPRSGDGREHPQHPVTITKPFYLAKYETPAALWRQHMKLRAYPADIPKYIPAAGLPRAAVEEFIAKLQPPELDKKSAFRLPTEAEWEYACRAGTLTATYAGDLSLDGDGKSGALEKIAWYAGNSEMKIQPSGKKIPNAFGLYDMLGNLREWCQDAYGRHPEKAVVDPLRLPPNPSARRIIYVLKGGHVRMNQIRSAMRSKGAGGDTHNFGIRLAFNPIAKKKK